MERGGREGRRRGDSSSPRYVEWVSEKRCRREEKKKSHPNNFCPLASKMQITDQRGLEWKTGEIGENIIKPLKATAEFRHV